MVREVPTPSFLRSFQYVPGPTKVRDSDYDPKPKVRSRKERKPDQTRMILIEPLVAKKIEVGVRLV